LKQHFCFNNNSNSSAKKFTEGISPFRPPIQCGPLSVVVLGLMMFLNGVNIYIYIYTILLFP
jgi:hypothetical protein